MRLVEDVDSHGRLGSAEFLHHPLEGTNERGVDLTSDDDVVPDGVTSLPSLQPCRSLRASSVILIPHPA